jgi:hypothetical protein
MYANAGGRKQAKRLIKLYDVTTVGKSKLTSRYTWKNKMGSMFTGFAHLLN